MLKRIKQFFRAVTAKPLTDEEQAFIAENLPPEALPLFYAQTLPDRRHALNVARTAQQLAKKGDNIDMPLLVRAALLHDVGRRKGDMGTGKKTLAVLIDKFFPKGVSVDKLSARRNKISRALFVYYHHGEIGAELLKEIGLEAEADLTRLHHAAPTENDPPELTLLRQADEAN